MLTSLIFGIAPAIQSSRTDLGESLKEGSKGTGTGSGSHRLLNSLVIVEIAIAVVLLVGAGLMINSLLRLQRVDPGFRTENILTMQLDLPEAKYPDRLQEQVLGFYRQLSDRVRSLPSVQSVGLSTTLPLTDTGWGKLLTREGVPAPRSLDECPVVNYRHINADYFKTLGIRLVAGRYLTDRDTRDTQPVAIINETMAKRLWPNEDPIGKRFWLGPPEELLPAGVLPPNYRFIRWTIAGVVADMKHSGLGNPALPEIFTLPDQALTNDGPARKMYLSVRSGGDPTGLTAAIRRQVLELDRELPIADVMTMEARMAASLSRSSFNTLLLTIFAVVALILSAVGVYGVMSYSVGQRVREIGIRMALGAQRTEIQRLMIRQGILPALIGAGIGIAGALALTHLISGLLFGVSARDPLTFALIALLLIVVALSACYFPARRASKVDPMTVLRGD
jgi:putative ABC transport system permease protein